MGLFTSDDPKPGEVTPATTEISSSPEAASPDVNGQKATAPVTEGGQPAESVTQPFEPGTDPKKDPPAAPEQGAEKPPDQVVEQPWKPVDLPEHMTPEMALGAARYWQSQHDSLQKSTEADLAQFQTMGPIVTELMKDNEALSYLSDRWNNQQHKQQIGQAPIQASVPESVNLPAPPDDLFTDEGDKWLKENFKAMAAQNQQLTQQVASLQQGVQTTLEQSQQQANTREAVLQVQNTMFWPQERAAQFVEVYRMNGLGIHGSWQEMAKAYESLQHPSADAVRQQQASQIAKDRSAGRMPQTATAAGGVGSAPTDAAVEGLFAAGAASDGGVDPYEI